MLFKTYELFGHRDIEDVAVEIVYYYLFHGESLTDIENRLFRTNDYNGWFSKSILNYYGIDTSLSGSNKGRYIEKNVPEIVDELFKSSNPVHLQIAKRLKDKYLDVKETGSLLSKTHITSDNDSKKLLSSNLYCPISKENLAQKKVGEIARDELYEVLGSGLVSDDEIFQLCQLEYSYKTLGLGYPLLLKVLPKKTRYEQAIFSGKVRYYAKKVAIYGTEYYITSEWYAKSKLPLMNWIMRFSRA